MKNEPIKGVVPILFIIILLFGLAQIFDITMNVIENRKLKKESYINNLIDIKIREMKCNDIDGIYKKHEYISSTCWVDGKAYDYSRLRNKWELSTAYRQY